MAPLPRVWIVFPRDVNWFYERAAQRISEAFRCQGIPTELCAAADLARAPDRSCETVLVFSLKECIASLPGPRGEEPFLLRLRAFRRRILANYDCLHAEWFRGQFTVDSGLITQIADINVLPQTDARRVMGVPYSWIPESLSCQEQAGLRPWSPGRPVSWAIVAHSSPARFMLLDRAVRCLGPAGFAFLPPLRPYREGNGTLTERSLERVLQSVDLYVWNSHHAYPFHEGLRAPQAVRNGAIPAKIDPLFSSRFAGVPWVFPDVQALKGTLASLGPEGLYDRCRTFLLARSMETHLARLVCEGSSPE